MREMAQNGFICFGYDHLGHGHTVSDESELGFIASSNGFEKLCKDVGIFAESVRNEYGRHLPYYLLGHSMGSFIVRLAAVKYIKPDKLIVMGTGGPNPVAGLGISVAKLIKRIYGENHVSPLLYSMAFGSYNAKFKAENDSKSWLTKDIGIRNKYKAEKLCMFKFTVSAMQDLITLNKNSNTKIWFESAAKICPILLVSGELDPVGENGKGVETVYNNLKSNGADVKLKLYKNCRHEILNDDCYKAVVNDILEFVNCEVEVCG
jgi:alpha-beta hydrolase superfamily lysophospholipase